MLPEIGPAGQIKLGGASVLLIGAGGLGSPVALYLAAAGVGRIGLVDADDVDLSNLQRQILFGSSDAGASKVERGGARLNDLNPNVELLLYNERLEGKNAQEIIEDGSYDVIVDGADNFQTRYLCNDLAVINKIPLVHGSIYRFEGQATVFGVDGHPCYRCLYPNPPAPGTVPSCGEIGVLGLLPGLIGMVMATETIKLILGIGEILSGRLLLYDAMTMRFRELAADADPQCPVCGTDPSITSVATFDYGNFCGLDASERKTTNEGVRMSIPAITVDELDRMRKEGVEHTLIDVREQNEYDFANIGGQLIPLGKLPERIDEVPDKGRVIVMCRSGGRSAQACAILQSAGRNNVENLTGGILAWSDTVDSSIPKY
jgi:adenylyltransferase/sulfurtransferase